MNHRDQDARSNPPRRHHSVVEPILRPGLRTAVALAFALSTTACADAGPVGPGSSEGTVDAAPTSPSAASKSLSSADAAPTEAPGAPTAIPFSNTFPGDDACTPTYDPEEHITTISGTIWLHELPNGNQIARWERTITTDTGYKGRGNRTVVNNGKIFKLTNNDVVRHPDGRAFLAHGVMVVDLTTAPPSVRVSMGGFTCIRS